MRRGAWAAVRGRPDEWQEEAGSHTSTMKTAALGTPTNTCNHTAQEKNGKNEKSMYCCRSVSLFGRNRSGGVTCAAGVLG